MGLFSFLTEQNVFEAYKKSQAYMKPFLDPLDEYERIARNQPHPGIDKAYPKVTDGTTASIIQKTPRRIIQQIPTGHVTSDTNDWLSIVAGFIFSNRIIPNANEQYAFIQKCWMMSQRSMTYGASHSLAPFIRRGDYFGTDLTVPYIKNVKFEAGKLSDLESNTEFLEAWYQTSDIEAIIHKEKQLKKEDKSYEPTWDLKCLEEIKNDLTAKSEDEQSRDENKRDETHKGGVKLVHCFQRGIGATFYTIHPKSGKIVRRKKNKDPRGEMPLQTMYFETDGMNPLGRGIAEQLAPLQNLTDSEVQMYQFERALMLAPPTIKRGNWNKTQAKLVPNAIIDLGSDPNASWEVLRRESSAVNNFPANYGLLKSQMLNLASSPDTSISSTIGNPGFSKTPAGVQATQQNVSVDDNYIRKQFESWFERWGETAINLYFAERSGVEELQLDKETAQRLRKIDDTMVSDDDKIMIDYDSATEALKFEVDASTSNMKNNAEQLQALDGLLERVQSSPLLQQVIPPKKVIGAWNSIVQASGVENPEDLSISDEELEEMEAQQQMAEEQAMQQQMEQQAMQEMPEEMTGEQQIVPEDIMQMEEPAEEMEMSEDDMQFVAQLQELGFDQEKIGQALALEAQGRSEEEIIEMLVA